MSLCDDKMINDDKLDTFSEIPPCKLHLSIYLSDMQATWL